MNYSVVVEWTPDCLASSFVQQMEFLLPVVTPRAVCVDLDTVVPQYYTDKLCKL